MSGPRDHQVMLELEKTGDHPASPSPLLSIQLLIRHLQSGQLLPPQGGDQRSRLHHKRLSWLSAAVFDPLLAGQTNELLSHTVFLFCPRSGPVKHSQTLPEKVITTHWLGWLSLNPSWMRSGLASFFFISCLKTVFWIDFSSVKLWISWHSQH